MKTNKAWIWALLGAMLVGLCGCMVEEDRGHRGGYYYDNGYGHGYGYDHPYRDHYHDHDWRY